MPRQHKVTHKKVKQSGVVQLMDKARRDRQYGSGVVLRYVDAGLRGLVDHVGVGDIEEPVVIVGVRRLVRLVRLLRRVL